VWSSGIEGTADRLPLAMTPRCAAIAPSGEFLYVAYKHAQSIAVVDLNSLEERHRIPVPAETHSLDITNDGKYLLALGSGFNCSYLSVIPLPIR
jgi:DNA-binding beta-propeller fold protein YncE